MDEKESKRTLAAVFVFCFRSVTCDCKHPGARARNRYQGGPNTDSFPAKGSQEFGQQEQEIKQFKWTIEAVANLKVRLKQTQQPGTRLETVVTEWGKAQKVRYTKTAQRG